MDRALQDKLVERVIRAAEAELAAGRDVCLLNLFNLLGMLAPRHIKEWRDGQIDVLETTINAGPQKVRKVVETFHGWAQARRLKPVEFPYLRKTRAGDVPLFFTDGGVPEREAPYRTHYVPAAMPEKKQKALAEKAARAADPVVFQILRDSECSECGAEISQNGLLLMEAGQPLCLPCAGLGNLEYLPAGDVALTRRSSKYCERKAVVVRFSRSRGRYERQGLLVEPAAIERAEQECSADADDRAKARAAGAIRRQADDHELVARMTTEILTLFPRCPADEAAKIAAHTAVRGSGRVGRSEAGRKLDEKALILAVRAAVRHNHTNYDEMLASGVEREQARSEISGKVAEILAGWS